MRNIIELLELVYELLEKEDVFNYGLCDFIDNVPQDIINDIDFEILSNYIDKHRPRLKYSWHDEKLFNELDIHYSPYRWGWLPGEKQPRLDWIKERIEIEKNNAAKS